MNCVECGGKHHAKGYCMKHYDQIRRNGKILDRNTRDLNEILIIGNIAEIVLYDVEGKEKARTIIDAEDIEKIKNYKWHITEKGYVKTNTNKGLIGIQHIIMNIRPKREKLVDHKDQNKLNNRKSNYRFCTHMQNVWNTEKRKNNTSGFKGVQKSGKMWIARIRVNNKRIHLGTFKDKISAALAYNTGAIKYHKEFACLNKFT